MIAWGSVFVVAGVASAIVLSGCGGGSSSGPATSTVTVIPTREGPTPSPSPSASPSPTLPAVARQPTRAGAQAFARYFFAAFNYSLWTRDASSVRAVSDSRCVYCNSIVSAVDSMREKSLRVEGGRLEVPTAVAAPGDPTDRLLVNLLVNQEPGRTLSESGDVVSRSLGTKNGRVDAAVRWRDGRWILLDAHILKPGES